MELGILDNESEIKWKEKELIIDRIIAVIKAILKMDNFMDKERNIILLMVLFMKDNFNKIKNMEWELFYILMEAGMKESLKMIKWMDKEK